MGRTVGSQFSKAAKRPRIPRPPHGGLGNVLPAASRFPALILEAVFAIPPIPDVERSDA